MTQSRAPLIVAIVLLLLPVMYVGSYLALVVPRGTRARYPINDPRQPGVRSVGYPTHYRRGHHLSERLFWPLEQIDRKVRPGAWEPQIQWKSSGGGAFQVRRIAPCPNLSLKTGHYRGSHSLDMPPLCRYTAQKNMSLQVARGD